MSFKKFSVIILLTCLLTTIFACKNETKSDKNASANVKALDTEESEDLKIDPSVFSVDTVDISDIEDGKTYQIIKYAVVKYKDNKALQDSLDELNANMKKAAEDFKTNNREGIRDFIKEVPEMQDAEYTHTSDIATTRNDKKYLSLTEFVYENTMGAHGNYVQYGHVYDVKTGKKLGLYDFVKDKEELRNYLKEWVDNNKDSMGLFDEAKDTIDAYINGEYELQFYIDNKLTVMFQTYDVAPYAAGLIEIALDDKLLKVKL